MGSSSAHQIYATSYSPPPINVVEVTAYEPEEESERLRSRGSATEHVCHLPKTFVHKGGDGGGHRLVRRDGPLERSLEGVLPPGEHVAEP